MKKFLIINGPNLNMLGKREASVYGLLTLEQIKDYTAQKLVNYDLQCEWFQSNIEGEIVTRIQQAVDEKWEAVIINPGAYSHTSVAILDALKILHCKIVEIHLTNTHSREAFRQERLTAKAAHIIMEGLGKDAYYLAILSQVLNSNV